MAVASLEAFRAIVLSNQALRSQVHEAIGVDDIVALAAQHGHDLDKAVLLREHAQAIQGSTDSDLRGINSWGDALMHAFGAVEASSEA